MKKIAQISIYLLFVAASDIFIILKYTDAPMPVRVLSIFLALSILLALQIHPYAGCIPYPRISVLKNGVQVLGLFLVSTVWNSALFLAILLRVGINAYGVRAFILHALFAFFVGLVTFWNGIIRLYVTSVQLGLKWRIIGIACGFIPIVHLVVLILMIRIVNRECEFELQKQELNAVRKENEICHTRYPLLLVHGVFFRDSRFFNYWGRIPAELTRNGATVFYGNQQSAASVPDSGRELAARIRTIVEQTGCEKVNIIAHSKGGLDSRYAVSCAGAADYVASITTINTPHSGCIFADYLLEKTSPKFQQSIARKYNSVLQKLGDFHPDFLAAVWDLTASRCRALNEEMKPVPGIFCQSAGSYMNHAVNGQFPLNVSYPLVRHFDGQNDGLVALAAMKWGSHFCEVRPTGARGISHGDMIDLNRANLDGFDVREFYVSLVKDLKARGL